MAYTFNCKVCAKLVIDSTATILDAKGQNPTVLGNRKISVKGGTIRSQRKSAIDRVWCRINGVGCYLVVDGIHARIGLPVLQSTASV